MLAAGDLAHGISSFMASILVTRSSLFMASVSTSAPFVSPFIAVKQDEPRSYGTQSFLLLKRYHTKVIELDSPSPPPKKPCIFPTSQENYLPTFGEAPDECEEE